MSQIITCNAYAQSHANSELPKTSPQNGHVEVYEHGAPSKTPSRAENVYMHLGFARMKMHEEG